MHKTQHQLTILKLITLAAAFASLPMTGMAQTATTSSATGTPMSTQTATTSTATSSQSQVSSTTTAMPKSIMIMKHLCNSSIKNATDFEAVEAGKAPVARLAATVLVCPTTGLPGDLAASSTVASPRTTYNFMLMASGTPDQMLSNAMFMQHKLCESDINVDVNGDGTISTSTCLDISHYAFTLATTSAGHVDVKEVSPQGRHMGALRFTPKELLPNNDNASLVSLDIPNSTIHLNTASDTNGTVMLHVYNFLDTSTSSASTTPSTGTSTTPTGTTTPVTTGTTTSTSTTPTAGTSTTPASGTTTPPMNPCMSTCMATSTMGGSNDQDDNDVDEESVEQGSMHRHHHHHHHHNLWNNFVDISALNNANSTNTDTDDDLDESDASLDEVDCTCTIENDHFLNDNDQDDQSSAWPF